MLNQKVETLDLAVNLCFVFVCLNDLGTPEYYVVPRRRVITYARENHAKFLSTLGKGGRKHQDTAMRKFRDAAGEFLNRWDHLGLDSSG
jgi:hypothetical protein